MPRDYDDPYDQDDENGYQSNNPFGFNPTPMRRPGYGPVNQNDQFGSGGPFGPGGPSGPGRPARPGRPGLPYDSDGFGRPGNNDMPPGPPPSDEPRRSAGGPSVFRVDAGAIRNCRNRYTYIWLENGRGFWAWLTFIGRNSVAGYRWTGYRWVYFGTDLDNISDFVCF